MYGAVKVNGSVKKQTSPGRPRLKFRVYKLRITQQLIPEDYDARYESACRMLQKVDDDYHLLNRIFSEATLHVSGHMNRYHGHVWGSKNPSVIMEHERASAKVDICCAKTHRRVIDPFFRMENTIPSISYLDMLEIYPLNNFWTQLFLQAGLQEVGRCIVCKIVGLTPMDFFLWG
jgi:hypothetical protein